MNFNSLPPKVVFQEVPDEVSLAFTVTGCPHACPGCHSQETWDPMLGTPLTPSAFIDQLHRYQGLITCVLFFGGEWQPKQLIKLLLITQNAGLKTCLYSGKKQLSSTLTRHLNYLKLGSWQSDKGGLESIDSNQIFIQLDQKISLNHLFQGA
jgi:anaerobic ribonucleoside-triphosphate reductase activating protein